MARTQTVSLGDHWNEFIDSMLEHGRFTSTSELIRASLRLLEEQEANSKVEALRAAMNAGEASGDAGPLHMAQIKSMARQKAGL